MYFSVLYVLQAFVLLLFRVLWWFTYTYKNLLVCRVPISSTLGYILRTHKQFGFGRLRYDMTFNTALHALIGFYGDLDRSV